MYKEDETIHDGTREKVRDAFSSACRGWQFMAPNYVKSWQLQWRCNADCKTTSAPLTMPSPANNDRPQTETWDGVLQKLESHLKWRIYTHIISDTGKSHYSITSGWDCSSSGQTSVLAPGLEQYMALIVQKRQRISLHFLQLSTNSGSCLASHWSLWIFPRIWILAPRELIRQRPRIRGYNWSPVLPLGQPPWCQSVEL